MCACIWITPREKLKYIDVDAIENTLGQVELDETDSLGNVIKPNAEIIHANIIRDDYVRYDENTLSAIKTLGDALKIIPEPKENGSGEYERFYKLLKQFVTIGNSKNHGFDTFHYNSNLSVHDYLLYMLTQYGDREKIGDVANPIMPWLKSLNRGKLQIDEDLTEGENYVNASTDDADKMMLKAHMDSKEVQYDGLLTDKYEKVPLFVRTPSYLDIRQGSIGDCYMLSAFDLCP